MGYQADGRRSAFDLGQGRGGRAVKSVGPQDSLTLAHDLRPGRAARPRRPPRRPRPRRPAAIAGLQPSDARGDWPAMFKRGRPAPRGRRRSRRRTSCIVTDLRREGWADGVTEVANRWAGAVGRREGHRRRQPRRRRTSRSLAFDQQDPVALPGVAGQPDGDDPQRRADAARRVAGRCSRSAASRGRSSCPTSRPARRRASRCPSRSSSPASTRCC